MKFLSIDTETTGTNPEEHQILSIGVIIEDTNNKLPFKDIPKFHCIILHDEIKGQPYALNLNKNIIWAINQYQQAKTEEDREILAQGQNVLFLTEKEVNNAIFGFLLDHNFFDEILDVSDITPITVAGKNFAVFDKLFLEKLPNWKDNFEIRRRFIDPAILFTEWNVDERLPDLTLCKKRAGIDGIVTHDALEDAWDIIQLMRTQY